MAHAQSAQLLCQYYYDALDRLDASKVVAEQANQFFYCGSLLTTAIQDRVKHSILQYDQQLLALCQHEASHSDTQLLVTHQQRSILSLHGPQLLYLAYSPYGHLPQAAGYASLLGYNGERRDPLTGHYHLGQGYRQYNPVLMRFNSPDSLSPFEAGGLNAYAYCQGDPVNRTDGTGHAPVLSPKPVRPGTSGRTVRPGRPVQSGQVNRSAARNPSTSDAAKKARRRAENNKAVAKHTAKLKKLADLIERNERAWPPSDKYTVNDRIGDLETSKQMYEYARSVYGFPGDPDVKVPHYYIDASGKRLLDLTHLNIKIDLERNIYKSRSNHLTQLNRWIVKRAEYIRKHTGINLMSEST